LFFHAAWALVNETRIGVLRNFLEYAASKPGVFFVTNQQLIEWMQDPVDIPTTAARLQCTQPNPTVWNVCNGGELKTCAYPWGSESPSYTFHTCTTCYLNEPSLTGDFTFVTCGDDVCEPLNETCASCPKDCGTCPPTSSSGSTSTTGVQPPVTTGTTGVQPTTGSSGSSTTAAGVHTTGTTGPKATTHAATTHAATTGTTGIRATTGTTGPQATTGVAGSTGTCTVVIDSSWSGGFCAHYSITNNLPRTSASWTITSVIPSTITMGTPWSCIYSSSGTTWEFSNVSWNGAIASGGVDNDAGFCSSYSTPTQPPFTCSVLFS